jgi:hypothetical protein
VLAVLLAAAMAAAAAAAAAAVLCCHPCLACPGRPNHPERAGPTAAVHQLHLRLRGTGCLQQQQLHAQCFKPGSVKSHSKVTQLTCGWAQATVTAK